MVFVVFLDIFCSNVIRRLDAQLTQDQGILDQSLWKFYAVLKIQYLLEII